MESFKGDEDIWQLTREEHIRAMIAAVDMGYAIKHNKGIGHGKLYEQNNNRADEEEDVKGGDTESELSGASEDWDSMDEEDSQEWEKELE